MSIVSSLKLVQRDHNHQDARGDNDKYVSKLNISRKRVLFSQRPVKHNESKLDKTDTIGEINEISKVDKF